VFFEYGFYKDTLNLPALQNIEQNTLIGGDLEYQTNRTKSSPARGASRPSSKIKFAHRRRCPSRTIAANWKLQLSNAVMKIYTKPFDFGRQEMFRLAACHVSYQQCSFMRL
jgi:hypothetical protein